MTEDNNRRTVYGLSLNPALRSVAIIIPALLIAGLIILLATLIKKSFQHEDEKDVLEYVAVEATGNKPEKVELPDGSTVWLKPGSIIRYPEDFVTSRIVYITTGEANFDVTKYNDQIFQVKTDQLTITVHGTLFNVRSYSNSDINSVVLINGSLEVQLPDKSVMLSPSEQIVYDCVTHESEVNVVDVSEFLDWIYEDLVIDALALPDALSKIADFYRLPLHLEGTLPDTKISITINNKDSLRDVIDILEILEPSIKCEVNETGIKVSRKY